MCRCRSAIRRLWCWCDSWYGRRFLDGKRSAIYAAGSGYLGDETIADVRKDRDSRLTIFLKEPGQKNILIEAVEGDHAVPVEPIPNILTGDAAKGYATGYALRKGGSFDQAQCVNGENYTGSITFRASEALLNYMEACYEKNGNLDAKAQGYWRALRERAHVDTDYNKTIAATVMSEEAKNDWGAYSAGQLVDPTLYNIRRERRCELMAEALRYMDLCRWRSMDQMIAIPYHIEGIKIWGEMQNWYKDEIPVKAFWFTVWIIRKRMFRLRVSANTIVRMKSCPIRLQKMAIDGLWLTT